MHVFDSFYGRSSFVHSLRARHCIVYSWVQKNQVFSAKVQIMHRRLITQSHEMRARKDQRFLGPKGRDPYLCMQLGFTQSAETLCNGAKMQILKCMTSL